MNNPEEVSNNETEESEKVEVTEHIYGADTFRDHDPVEQIYHNYEVWDRHYR